MKLIFKFLILILGFYFIDNTKAVSFFSDYKAKKAYENNNYEKVIEILEKEQVDKPDDVQLNYNLGSAYYKLKKFDQAKANFQRAIGNCTKDQNELKEFSYFNWGNSFSSQSCPKIF